jgi:Na+/phosphate symporter
MKSQLSTMEAVTEVNTTKLKPMEAITEVNITLLLNTMDTEVNTTKESAVNQNQDQDQDQTLMKKRSISRNTMNQ